MRAHRLLGQAGKGVIGLIVAVIVVLVVGISLKGYYQLKSRSDALDDYAYESLKNADLKHKSVEDVRFDMLKKAKELGIPLKSGEQIEVSNDTSGWQLRMAYDDELSVLGYKKRFHYVIDKSFKRF